MKKTLILIAITLLLPVTVLSVQAKEREQISRVKPEIKMSLNGGKRWNADEIASLGIKNMSILLAANTGKILTLKEYNDLGTLMIEHSNIILNYTTMKGQAVDEFVKLMLQVIEEIRVLKGNEAEQSQLALNRLKGNLDNFSIYFE